MQFYPFHPKRYEKKGSFVSENLYMFRKSFRCWIDVGSFGRVTASRIFLRMLAHLSVAFWAFVGIGMIIPTTVTAQSPPPTLAWAARYNGTAGGYHAGQALSVDASGNLYVTGYSCNQTLASCDYATVKYDQNGNQLWAARYDNGLQDMPSALAIDSAGNVYVTGTSKNTTGYDTATVKYSPNGSQLWVARYPNNDGYGSPAIAVDSAGNVYVTSGTFITGTGSSKYYTVKYNTNGTQLWSATYGTPGLSHTTAIAVDSSGNVYVTGELSKGTSSCFYCKDYGTVKYNTNGTQLWASIYDSGSDDSAKSLAVDGSGNVYVTGYSLNGTNGSFDYATVKYSPNGSQVWVVRYDNGGYDYANAITVDSSGNAYVTGASDNTTNSDFATVKYDPGGNRLWVARYDDGFDEAADAMSVDGRGNIYVTGNRHVPSFNDVFLTIKYTQSCNGTGGAPKPTSLTSQSLLPIPTPKDQFDIRIKQTVPKAHPSPGQLLDLRHLGEDLGDPDLGAEWHHTNGTLRHLALSGAFPKTPGITDPETVAKEFLKNYKGLFLLSDEEVAEFRVVRNYKTHHNGITHLIFQQYYQSIPIHGGEIRMNLDEEGHIQDIWGGDYVLGIRLLVMSLLTPSEALKRAAQDVAPDVLFEPEISSGPTGPTQATEFRRGPFLEPHEASLVIFPMPDEPRLAWEVMFHKNSVERYFLIIDAKTGDLLYRTNLVNFSQPQGSVFKENPDKGGPVVMSFVGDPVASPRGWVDDILPCGNNVVAQEDRNGNDTGGYRPSSATQNFQYPFQNAYNASGGTDVNTDLDIAITNLFWMSNFIHDYYYALGFDESAGNFQLDNLGRGGVGGDNLTADAQDGWTTCPTNQICRNNANFFTPVDGKNPRMQMYLFTSPPLRNADGDFDGGVIIHEYTHGLSNRLVAGPFNVTALFGVQSGAMGEGWGDWFAASIFNNPVVGAYVTGNPTTGIRQYALNNNPLTYANLCGLNHVNCEVHNDGEIWSATLWDLRTQYIARYGINPGEKNVERLVVDGMKRTPASPSMLNARDAILFSDLFSKTSNGANLDLTWTAFAGRGMGWSASTTGDNDANPVQAFDGPPFINLSASPNPFSPNGSGANNTTTITATFSKALYWLIEIRDNSGNVLKSCTGGSGTSATCIWDGKNSSLVIVPDGTYTFTVRGIEQAALQKLPMAFGTVVVSTAAIGLSPTSLGFSATQGGTNPVNQSLTVTNVGRSGSTLNWTASTSTSNGGNWLSVTPASGTAPSTLTVSVNSNGLVAGTYNGTITVSSNGAANSPQTVPVTLTIAPPPSISNLTPSSGSIGESVTISGSNFGSSQGNNNVTFNGIPGAITSWAVTSITVTVPAGATTGNVIVTVDGSPSNGLLFTVTCGFPIVTTNPATGITPTQATLNGTVNPNACATTGWFEWGTTTSYGQTTAGQPVGSGTTAVAISQTLTGLVPNTTYHYRAVGQNSVSSSFGADQTFTTLAQPPVVSTGSATNITSTTATLNGTANSNGVSGTVWFEYGLTASYGSTSGSQAISGAVANNVSITITGLTSNTTYHYRIGAQNNGGTSYGTDATFTTLVSQDRLPTSNVSVSGAWSTVGCGGSKAYQCVDDPIGSPNNSTDYIRVQNSPGNGAIFGFSPFTIPSGVTVQFVRVTYVATVNIGSADIQAALRVSGTIYTQPMAQVLTTAWPTYSYNWAVNPGTSTSWTVAEVNGSALQGMGVVSGNGDESVTQVYVTVVYQFDTTPPTAPTNLTATPVSPVQINLSWTASTDNVGVTGYQVERCQGVSCSNFTQVATSTGTSYSDVGLLAGTSYSYRVRATDAAGNLSGYSNTASATPSQSSNTWTTMSPMPTARRELAVGAVNGILYAIGGRTGNSSTGLGTVEAYDPATNMWTTKAPMPTPRSRLGIGVVNGILYAVGGRGTSGGALTTVEAYDPATNTWTTKAPMLTARDGLAVDVVNGILYAMGGYISTTSTLASVEAYNPATNTWTAKASMPTGRYLFATGVVSGILYAVGGYNGGTILATVAAYNPATNSWSAKTSMPTARYDLAGGVINGLLYAVGGQNSSNGNLATNEAYNPATNSWTNKASMPTGRSALGAGVVNGLLYAVGGQNVGNGSTTVEAYIP